MRANVRVAKRCGPFWAAPYCGVFDGLNLMDISRSEQRVLHELARGGVIRLVRDARGRVVDAQCFSRDGWRMNQCDLTLFRKLKGKRAIRSVGSGPYKITRRGLVLVRPQVDNR